MNLGFDAKRLFLNPSGLGNYSRWLLRGLLSEFPGNQYHLYTTRTAEINPPLAGEHLKIHLPPNLFKTFWRTKGIKKNLIQDQIEVYHGLSNEIPLGIEKTGIKTVVTIHDLIFKLFPEYYSNVDRAIYDKKFRSACERSSKIIAVSKQTAASIQKDYQIHPEKIEVIYMDASDIFRTVPSAEMVSLTLQKFNIKSPYFICVGAIGGRKNQFRLIEAFGKIASDIPQDLVLVGKAGKQKDLLNETLNRSGLANRILHLENVNDHELLHLYHGSQALAFPSVYEGFGIPIVESYRCGKPVLTSRGSSLEEISGKAALLCDPWDTYSIAEQMLNISDHAVRENLIRNIPSEIKKFDNKSLIQQYVRIYESLMIS